MNSGRSKNLINEYSKCCVEPPKKSKKKEFYVFYTNTLPLTCRGDIAHFIHEAQCANAAHNLGYKTCLVYGEKGLKSLNPFKWVFPFLGTNTLDEKSINFYGVERDLKGISLMMPPPIDLLPFKWTNSAVIATKYYLPLFILPFAKVLHTQDLLAAEAAVESKTPVVYEQHYLQKSYFKSDLVKNPFFRLTIVQSEVTRQSLIDHGMPKDKVVQMDNGFESESLVRHPLESEKWRNELLGKNNMYLAVYSGALMDFKGVGMLIDVAKMLPQVKFVLTGGSPQSVSKYESIARDKKVDNVKFLGFLAIRRQIFNLLQAADVLLEPHMMCEHAEYTNPVKFFQYLGSGAPIAASSIPFYQKFQREELAICWSKPNDPIEYADTIRSVLKNYPRRQDGYLQNINFSHRFTWEKRLEKILALAS